MASGGGRDGPHKPKSQIRGRRAYINLLKRFCALMSGDRYGDPRLRNRETGGKGREGNGNECLRTSRLTARVTRRRFTRTVQPLVGQSLIESHPSPWAETPRYMCFPAIWTQSRYKKRVEWKGNLGRNQFLVRLAKLHGQSPR